MRIIVTGGSGLIGKQLVCRLLERQHEVVILSRRPERIKTNLPNLRVQYWDPMRSKDLGNLLEGSDAVINLAGESIAAKRWTAAQKERIRVSRVASTQALVDALQKLARKPSVLLQASAVGYYGNVPGEEISETHPPGRGLLSDVCRLGETEAQKAEQFGVRVVLLRSGLVLDAHEGALPKLLRSFKMFLGGTPGNGKQWIPWIHIADEVNAILYALNNETISGPLNLVAPRPVQMKDFCKMLGALIKRPSWLPIPSFVLHLALGEMAESLLLQSQKVAPAKLLEVGFHFQYPNLEQALRNIVS